MEQRKKIILVDDEISVLTALSRILEHYKYEVIPVTKGTEVLGLARQVKPDLIILDILMPDKDGADVAAELVENPETRDIPILFLTGIIYKKEGFIKIKAGKTYDIIAKPVTEGELIGAVNKALGS